MSKLAISCQGRTLDDAVDPRFGRAAYFVVVDDQSMAFSVVDNTVAQSMGHGAGIQAAEAVANAGADAVLSGYVGPKAFQALEAAGLRIGQDVDGMTVREAVERFKAGQVNLTSPPKGGGR